MKMFHYLFMGFNIFLGVVGSFTLIVGGVGVANIMYIVVRERTREIGIKRALGARRKDILVQIFAETALIVAVGAGFGLLISAGMVKLASMLPIQEQVGTPEEVYERPRMHSYPDRLTAANRTNVQMGFRRQCWRVGATPSPGARAW